ncbi:MAG: tetratricopeptide repeat protein [Terracidiphilus sp.]
MHPQNHPISRTIPAALLATAALIVSLLAQDTFSHRHSFDLATVHAASPLPLSASITVDYPEEGSIFPPEITPPTFIWHDGNAGAKKWRIDITFDEDSKQIHSASSGEPIQLGEIDPRTVSINNEPPALTPEQASAHTWIPDAKTWEAIKQHSRSRAARVTITGVDATDHPVSQGRVAFSTSMDPVGAPIFYRDVPLMPTEGVKGQIEPLGRALMFLINWQVRDVGQPASRVVLHDMHTCANCHSFSADGKTMGMDLDGPRNDKGLYALVPVQRNTVIRNQDVLSWNSNLTLGKSRIGFMSQVSPDGKYVLSTFAGQDLNIGSSYFVANFKDYRFLQVFYPTRGILAWYDRASERREPLPGADDPRYVQTDGVWSPDGKYIIFARAEAKEPYPEEGKPALAANDPNEIQIQYSLYRIPFNGGKGGVAEPIEGASNNGMSNNFPKVSPDGRWIVFVKCKNGQLMRPDSQLYMVPFKGGVARRMRCNTSLMNSWHSFSPNGRWMVFSSKSRSPYTQMFLTHIDPQGNDSPPIYIDNAKAANRAVNLPEFINIAPDGLEKIDVPASDFYRIVDEASDLEKNGDWTGSFAKWQKALELDPNDARANNSVGVSLASAGKPADAIPYFQKATQMHAEYSEAYYNLGMALNDTGRVDEAIVAWLSAVRLQPEMAEAQESLGVALYSQRKYADSAEHLRIAAELQPDRVFALNLRATILATCPDDSVRNGAAAVPLAERAMTLTKGENAFVLDTLSAAYAEAGRFSEAIATEQQAINIAVQEGNTNLADMLKDHQSAFTRNLPLRVIPPEPH